MNPKSHQEKEQELQMAFHQKANSENISAEKTHKEKQQEIEQTFNQSEEISAKPIVPIQQVEMSGMLLEMDAKDDVKITPIKTDPIEIAKMPEDLERAQQAAYDAQLHLLNENQKLQQALFQLHQAQEKVRQLQQQVQDAQQQVQITQATASTIVNNLAK